MKQFSVKLSEAQYVWAHSRNIYWARNILIRWGIMAGIEYTYINITDLQKAILEM